VRERDAEEAEQPESEFQEDWMQLLIDAPRHRDLQE